MYKDIDIELINQFVLHKQHLTEDSKAESKNLVEVVNDICGLHSQVASTPFISLWNRIDNFQKEDLSKELYERRTLVKIWGVRATLHIVPTAHVVEYYQATKRAGGRHPLIRFGPVHQRMLKILDEKGPLTARELTRHIMELNNRVQTKYGDMSLGQWNLRQMCHSAILVPGKPKGEWTSNLHTYINFKKWLPSVNLEALNEREAKKNVIFHYLSGFGPATVEDIAWWIGIARGEITEILDAMSDIVELIKIRGLEGMFFILKSDLEQLQGFSSGTDTMHLLPKFDPYIMGYKNRQRIIPTEYEKRVYWSTRGEISPSILVNGHIIGTWNHKEEKNKIKITLSLFEKTNEPLLDTIKQQAERLAHFIGGKNPEIGG
ncbi:MAG TPA: winged helix DNA-binding domain-containing protein [Candidatus Methanoperedens sp.]